MKKLDSKLMKKFLVKAGDLLKGDWLLVGGTLLPAVGLDVRATVDIDIVSLNANGKKGPIEDQTLGLMEIAENLDLGVESINQAAAYFLKKCGYKKEDLISLHKGKKAHIYRPSVQLY